MNKSNLQVMPATEKALFEMKELNLSNAALGDQKALAAAWDRDGYWFFKDVLDVDAVAALRKPFIEELARVGVVSPDAQEPIWNGASLENVAPHMEPLWDRSIWKNFVASPQIARFFHDLLGDAPYWLPMVEYRATPPKQDEDHPFLFPHQDGYFYNSSIPCYGVWVPVATIDKATGGFAIVEGMHDRFHHDVSKPHSPMNYNAIPDDAWRRSATKPGDVILFDMMTPHSGLGSSSDRFRLSIDLRVMPATSRSPFIGKIHSVNTDFITVDNGGIVTLALHDGTYIRKGKYGGLAKPAEIEEFWRPGDDVIVAAVEGKAAFVRPPHG